MNTALVSAADGHGHRRGGAMAVRGEWRRDGEPGPERVFMNIDDVPLGIDFVEHVTEQIAY